MQFDSLLKLYNDGPVKCVALADDVALLACGIDLTTVKQTMQTALNKAARWSRASGLEFATAKSQLLVFTNNRKEKNRKLKLKLNGETVPHVHSAKYLGVILDDNLSFIPHMKDKIAKAKRALLATSRICRDAYGLQPSLVRWLWSGCAKPSLTYGSIVVKPRLTQRRIIARLRSLQRLALSSVANTRLGTPAMGLEVMTGQMPLDLAMEQIAMTSYVRIRPAITWEPTSGLPSKQGHLHVLRKLTSGLGNLDLDEIPEERHWKDLYTVDTSRDHGGDTSEGVEVFTDGSLKNKQSGSGAVIRLPDNDAYTISANTNYATVFQSELQAIKLAVDSLIERATSNSSVSIYVDSQAALQSLRSRTVRSKLVKETRATINNLAKDNKEVNLKWIKAHHSHSGNEAADEQARKGGELPPDGNPVTGQTWNQIRDKIRKRQIRKWNTRWTNAKGMRQTKCFFPVVSTESLRKSKAIMANSRTKVGFLLRFMSGHCFMRRHRRLLSGPDYEGTASCRLCGDGDEEPQHLWMTCSTLTRQRWELTGVDYLDKGDYLSWDPGILAKFIDASGIGHFEDEEP